SYSVYDGKTWSGPYPVLKSYTCDEICTVVYEDELYLFHWTHDNPISEVLCQVYNGSRWVEAVWIPRDTTRGGISAVVYNEQIWCFSNDLHGQLRYDIFNGGWWEPGHTVADVSGKLTGGSLVGYLGKTYFFYRSLRKTAELCYHVYDGSTWSAEMIVPGGKGLSGNPAAGFDEGKIYCFYHGPNSDGTLHVNVFDVDGTSWSGDTDITLLNGIYRSPAAVFYNNTLWCVSQAASMDRLCFQIPRLPKSTIHGSLPSEGITGDHQVEVLDGKLYCWYFHQQSSRKCHSVSVGRQWREEKDVFLASDNTSKFWAVSADFTLYH
ncbi:hypothetical protein QBC38DRAFT_377426, partial [Podospora fimiseda]